MKKTNILLVSNNETQVNEWVTIFNRHDDWHFTHALNDEDAIEKFHQYPFEVIVLGKDLVEDTVKKLTKLFTLQAEDVIFINAADDAEGKIKEALAAAKRNNVRFSFVDDALKNAGLNIAIQ